MPLYPLAKLGIDYSSSEIISVDNLFNKAIQRAILDRGYVNNEVE
jgi:hypothetical protein